MNLEIMPFDQMDFLTKAGGGRTNVSYKNKAIIFSQGDVADSVFYIQKGKVKLSVVSNHGKEAVVAILIKSEFFGEGCLAGQKARPSTAAAVGECQIMRLDKSAIVFALRTEHAFADLFMKYLLERTIRVEEDLTDQLFNSSERRLARALLLLANFGKDGSPEPIIGHVSQETLAEMIGTTRSRVSFFMNKFRKLGLISYNGKIEVHKSLLNLVLHEQPRIDADGSSTRGKRRTLKD
jgi:CRP-like cAMP-binding protein